MEHVWPAWCSRLLGNLQYDTYWSTMLTDRPSGDILRHRRKHETSKGIAKKVVLCRRCNGHILGRFENDKARPTISPLIMGYPTTLDRTQQTTLAAWMTKIAMTVASLDRENHIEMFPAEERQLFIETLLAPHTASAWIGDFRPFSARDMTLSQFQLVAADNQTPIRNITTCTLGCLVFQLGAVRWNEWTPAAEARSRDTLRVIQGRWWPVCSQVWPVVNESVIWPPPQYLTEDTFHAFADRWGGDSRAHGERKSD